MAYTSSKEKGVDKKDLFDYGSALAGILVTILVFLAALAGWL